MSDKPKKAGPTGNFPSDRMNENDEGELAIAIGIIDNKVVMDFGIKISWIGLDKDNALAFGNKLIELGNKL